MLKRLRGVLTGDAARSDDFEWVEKSSHGSSSSGSSHRLQVSFAGSVLDQANLLPARSSLGSPTTSPISLAGSFSFSKTIPRADESRTYLEPPRVAPDLNIPHATGIAEVRIINTTTHSRRWTAEVLGHPLVGHEILAFPSYAFFVRNVKQNINVLFDLGMRKDRQNVCYRLSNGEHGYDTPQVAVAKDIHEVLLAESNSFNICVHDVAAVIWSSQHSDHRGDISTFPSRTKLIVGPGMREAYENKEIDQAEFQGREVFEMCHSDFRLSIGGFAAHDVFNDGSFYLLSCPGPSVGHMCGLARVTVEPISTFVFLGGDGAHHCGQFRPSPYLPLPRQVLFKPTAWFYENTRGVSAPTLRSRKTILYSGEHIRDNIHPLKSASDSFYEAPDEPLVTSQVDTNESLAKIELFDACPQVLMCLSHDPTLMNVLPFYPFSINDWYKRGHKKTVHWEFLYDFFVEKTDDRTSRHSGRSDG